MADVRRSTTECLHTCQWSWGLLQLVGHSYATAVLKAESTPRSSATGSITPRWRPLSASTRTLSRLRPGRQQTRSPLWSWAPPKGPSSKTVGKTVENAPGVDLSGGVRVRAGARPLSALGAELAQAGVVGRVSIDFATAQDATGRWWSTLSRSIFAKAERPIRMRRCAISFPAAYDLESGRWVCTDGSERAYQATDNVLDDALAGGSARWWSRRCGLPAVSDRRDRGR